MQPVARRGAAVLLLAASLAAQAQAPVAAPEFGQVSKDSVWVTTPERMIRPPRHSSRKISR